MENLVNNLKGNSLNFAVDTICPACHQSSLELLADGKSILCRECAATYPVENGFPDLIVGDRFEDESDTECLCYEESSNEYTAKHYWIPLFKDIAKNYDRKVRVLAVGCGTGVEVDMLCREGFECIGIDCGNRTRVWPNREFSQNFLLANGQHLPFPDDSFDIVFCGCVFPHVGVVGDSFVVKEDYLNDRLELASEMSRVLRQGGKVVVSSPNRLFPFDIFHGRAAGEYIPRFNRPGERFLLSASDYENLFLKAGCKKAVAQKTEGYWGFVRSKHSLKATILSLPIRFIFWITSRRAFSFLRTTPVSPWLVLVIPK